MHLRCVKFRVKYACGVWIYFISLLISQFASSKLFHIERYARYFTVKSLICVINKMIFCIYNEHESQKIRSRQVISVLTSFYQFVENPCFALCKAGVCLKKRSIHKIYEFFSSVPLRRLIPIIKFLVRFLQPLNIAF